MSHESTVEVALRADPSHWLKALPDIFDKAQIEREWWALCAEVHRLRAAEWGRKPCSYCGG